MKKNHPWSISGNIFINYGEEGFLGRGRVALLEYIREYGSLNKAARKMKMSYKAAWDVVHSMNEMNRDPLVIFQTGGKGGGGAVLTEEGIRWIELFHAMETENSLAIRLMNDKYLAPDN